jgi:hypothetical protein
MSWVARLIAESEPGGWVGKEVYSYSVSVLLLQTLQCVGGVPGDGQCSLVLIVWFCVGRVLL